MSEKPENRTGSPTTQETMTRYERYEVQELCRWRFLDLDYGLDPWRAVENLAPYNDRPQVWCTNRETAHRLGHC